MCSFITLDLNSFCEENNIVVCPELNPREEDEIIDYLNRCFDSGDWKIITQYLKKTYRRGVGYAFDRHIASHFSNQCLRFKSRWWVPRTEAVGAFTQYLGHDINWYIKYKVPPLWLVPDCIRKMYPEKAKCALIIPKSVPFWPMFNKADRKIKTFILLRFASNGVGNNVYLGKGFLSFNMLALKCLP
jgi:hypothetical protein